MKKKIQILLILITIITLSVSLLEIKKVESTENFQNTPYSTWIEGLEGELVTSSTAYEGIYVLNPGFKEPSDIFIDENDICYIADKGNSRIYIYDHLNKTSRTVGEKTLSEPTGVAVNLVGDIYVADKKNQAVYVFNQAGELINTFLRPTEYLYGEDTAFIPTKVAVDSANNLYITCQGNANGIIQLNKDGEFLGYFGPNKVQVTFDLLFKRFFMSKEDREIYASLSPKVTTNICVDDRNTVYSIINGEGGVSLKKFNVNGTNILNGKTFFSQTYQDICVDNNGFIYAVDQSSTGVISVLDPTGNLLFKFGNTKTGSMSIGQFDKTSGIDVDTNGNIYVTDSSANTLQIFIRTEFATTVLNALLNYNEGEYDRAVTLYNEILESNSNFVEAYVGLGKIAQRNQDYKKAIEYFKISRYQSGYSEVFWELRDDWLSKYLIWSILIIIVLLVLKVFHVYSKVYNKITPEKVKEFFNRCRESKLFSELKYLGHILRHPFDTFYDIKFQQKIRRRTALGIFIFFIFMNIICDNYLTGYLYRANLSGDINLAFEILKWGLIIIIFVVANYLISTLLNGEGFFRDIFIGTIYAFAPLILFKIPLSLVSNVLTYNESFIYKLIEGFLWAWSIFNCILMLKDIHNFTFGQLLLNIILTALAMIVIVLVYLMVYILSMQLIQFIINLIKEAIFING